MCDAKLWQVHGGRGARCVTAPYHVEVCVAACEAAELVVVVVGEDGAVNWARERLYLWVAARERGGDL